MVGRWGWVGGHLSNCVLRWAEMRGGDLVGGQKVGTRTTYDCVQMGRNVGKEEVGGVKSCNGNLYGCVFRWAVT